MNPRLITISLLGLVLGLSALPAGAVPISVMVGDNDGYGFGIADNANTPAVTFDNRSAAELAATDGSQFTDFAPGNFDTVLAVVPFDVFFGPTVALTSGTATIDVQGIQLGGTELLFNGISQGEIISFTGDIGATGSRVFSVALSAGVIAAANLAGEFIITVQGNDNPNVRDVIAFDYFQLDADVVPEPSSLALLSLIGLLGLRRPTGRRRTAS